MNVMKGVLSIGMLVLSNMFMTMAWYGHLKFQEWGWMKKSSLILVIAVSWGMALFEYCFQVPANRIGFNGNGGPFSLFQLKVIQEVITLIVFVVFAHFFFGNEPLKPNHLIAFVLLVLAVVFAFKG